MHTVLDTIGIRHVNEETARGPADAVLNGTIDDVPIRLGAERMRTEA